MKTAANKSNRRLAYSALAAGLVLALGALVAFLTAPRATVGDVEAIEDSLRGPLPTAAAEPATGTTPATTVPIEEEPVTPLWEANPRRVLSSTAEDTWPNPVGLRIEALGLDAPVEAYGVDGRTGQMDVPSNAHDVGWYKFGPKPGQAGSAVLAAHVDFYGQGRGVFFELKELEPGDRVVVIYDNGTEVDFEVDARTTYAKEELPLDIIFSDEGEPILTLITCGGGFNSTISSYDSNVVVYAAPVSPRSVTS